MLAIRFPFFGSRASNNAIDQNSSNSYSLDGEKPEVLPSLKLATDKDVYRPGDSISVTIEICNPASSSLFSLLIEKLGFEIKGIEKLDTQWYATQRSLSGSRQRRGEHVFMDSSIPALVSNQIVSSGATKSYIVRTVLPDVIPPSYRGATIRYLYYVKTVLSGRWLMLENSHSRGEFAEDLIQVEARIPLQIWVTQKSNGLLVEEGQSDGIVPATIVKPDIYWKEIDGDAEWVRVNDTDEGVEEGYESSKDEVSSVSSYNPSKENIHKNFGSSLSLQTIGRSSNKEASYNDGRASFSSILSLPRLSMAEVSYDSSAEMSSLNKQSGIVSPHQQQKTMKSEFEDDAAGVSSSPGPGTIESSTSEGFIRGRSYNIRVDDQVLLRFSPKNSDSTYYFSDMIGGTLTFFHEEGAKRCLEVSITLETSENINRRFVHPSRRNSPTITKVQSDHQEVVADLVQTSFLFSVPMDGPMSFSTPHVSVQWVLRFEFFTTPKNVDWRRYEHPLLIEGKEKSEWILPITVHAPPPGTPTAHTRNEKLYSSEPLWVRT